MDIKEILGRCDHTLLTVDATWEDIRAIVDDGIAYSTASVCIPPCYVKAAAEYAAGRVAVCTVIGFPCGYSDTEVKVAECRKAVLDGADEIDMVINVGYLKAGRHAEVLAEINAVKAEAGDKILRSLSRPACSPRRRRSPPAASYQTPRRTISRPPRASRSGALRPRTWL